MRTFAASSRAEPAAAWRLLARPDLWSRWSPHVRGAWRLGAPEVRQGAVGAARLHGVVPVPARIVGKHPGRSWTWQIGFGLVEIVHRVEARPEGGATVAVDVIAPEPLERALAMTCGPIIERSLERLARRAERS